MKKLTQKTKKKILIYSLLFITASGIRLYYEFWPEIKRQIIVNECKSNGKASEFANAAYTSIKNNDLVNAEYMTNIAYECDKSNSKALGAKIRYEMKFGNFNTGYKIALETLKKSKNDSWTTYEIGYQAFNRRKYGISAKFYKKSYLIDKEPTTLHALGRAYQERWETQKSDCRLQKYLREDKVGVNFSHVINYLRSQGVDTDSLKFEAKLSYLLQIGEYKKLEQILYKSLKSKKKI